MNRRDFLSRSTAAALLAAVPVVVVAATRGPLLEDPTAWIGTTFRLADGSRLELAAVEELACDRYSTQVRMHFRTVSGVSPAEGTHALSSAWSEEDVFLQPGRVGAVACINRLHGWS
jgi:hypothetical protein